MEAIMNVGNRNPRRFWIALALILIASFVMVYALWLSTSMKVVELTVNGETERVETSRSTVSGLLEQQNIEVSGHDRLSVPLSSKLEHGDHIEIQFTVPVQVDADGERRTLYTVGDTVREALVDLSVALDANDKVNPPMTEQVEAGLTIKVTRVDKKVVDRRETIAYEEKVQSDPNLLKGKKQVVQEGQEGILHKRIELTYEDGEIVKETVVSEEIAREAQDRIVAVGSKSPVQILSVSSPTVHTVSKDGMTFGVRRILDDVTLTAYHAGLASTGKTSDHPEYGITYTGSRVREGRTIAVDPKVIPLRWWVYIEGIGFRRAEDIGSAIKGKKVDIYMETEAEANRFGRQGGYTVYVIGPDKPGASEQ